MFSADLRSGGEEGTLGSGDVEIVKRLSGTLPFVLPSVVCPELRLRRQASVTRPDLGRRRSLVLGKAEWTSNPRVFCAKI